ncbi:T9SS-dependent choice-of-anchor J family protein [Flavobacterium sp.]|uniref:T9SS-dependent choice-of-anchor J family protein n=1 Tax=Flavobacterium sp. TaxID=239 RepID=UPI00286D327F|nr:choice-of-anchor J domain-containing protein [Flavobacterium sp.]
MKIKIYTALLILVSSASQAQTLLTENFDTFPVTWTKTNQSQPVGTSNWQQGNVSSFGGGFNGGATSYTAVNYNSVASGMSGTISNWLISPIVSLKDGDVIKFYTRAGANFSSTPDRLELRLSTVGSSTINPSTGSSDLGSFTYLAVSVNPLLAPNVYPVTWTEYTYTVGSLPDATDCKLAFRYFVTNGGPTGANGNAIWVDALTVNRVLSTDTFFKSNFSVFPNPTSNVLNITNNSDSAINNIQVTDINGRIVKEVKINTNQINISELNAGVYLLKISTDNGTGTTKIVKS